MHVKLLLFYVLPQHILHKKNTPLCIQYTAIEFTVATFNKLVISFLIKKDGGYIYNKDKRKRGI